MLALGGGVLGMVTLEALEQQLSAAMAFATSENENEIKGSIEK